MSRWLERLGGLFLRRLPAEPAHRLAVWAMERRVFAHGTVRSAQAGHLFGVALDNPLGLAAGFDKNGRLIDAAPQYGFGFVEVGSITWHAHPGNQGRRLFRLNAWDILNRMGLNSAGAEAVSARLDAHRHWRHYGLSITKSNKPEITGEAGIADILRTFQLLSRWGLYHVFNLSCPNTHSGGTFEDPAILRELLLDVQLHASSRPWGVKLSPHQPRKVMERTVAVCEENGCHFYVLGNTLPVEHPRYGRGGQSGRALLPLTLPRVRWLAAATRKPVIGCGGIFTGRDMYLYRQAGAVAYQVLNGFVRGPYHGPRFAATVLNEFDALCAAEQEFKA